MASVSPELMLRPSLSARASLLRASSVLLGVAGAYAPAFVERRQARAAGAAAPAGVAGAYAPAFVERWKRGQKKGKKRAVSPELMLRPSLSVLIGMTKPIRWVCVAGAYAPAFVERPRRCSRGSASAEVSPELMLRPSLSGAPKSVILAQGSRTRVAGAYAPAFVERLPSVDGRDHLGVRVSPELMLRPSLSERRSDVHRRGGRGGVAGAYAPAFVERCRTPS